MGVKLNKVTRISIRLALVAFCIFGLNSSSAHSDKEVPTRFEYYSRDNPSVPINGDDIDMMETKKVLFYIHGWNAANLDECESRKIKDVILEKRQDIDMVILVDWVEVSNYWDYLDVAEKYAPKVARHLKNEVERLYNFHEISTSDMEMVGHSLEAHIMGQAGRLWNSEGLGPPIAKMTALDPAGPWFEHLDKGKRMKISKDDAAFVRGIHTDCRLGLFEEIGHEDIYPYTQEVILDCEGQKTLSQDTCLHRVVKDLWLQELGGAVLVDPSDPTRGKERPFSTLINPLGRSISITMLVLDVSPSMQEYGRMNSMITATKRHIKTKPIGTFVGIVIFGGTAQVSQSPVNITDEVIRKSILSKVPNKDTNIWRTSIGAGLLQAIDSFTAILKSIEKSRSCPNIILITDGEENTAPYRKDVEPLIPKCTRVYPIALGAEADSGLEELSQKTNGQTASASDYDSLNRLTQSLQDSSYAQIDKNHRPIKLPSKEVEFNGVEGTDFLLDRGLGKNTEFLISTPYYDKIFPILTAPNGTIFLSDDFSMEQDLTARVLKLADAAPGKWNLKVQLNQTERRRKRSQNSSSVATVFVTTMQTSKDEIPIRLEGLLSNNRIEYPSAVTIQAKVRRGDDDLILGAKVEAYLISPKSNGTINITLLDNGIGADEMKDDGIYSRQIVQELVPHQIYEVSVLASQGPNAKIMPAKYISFMPPNYAQRARFEAAYAFERQIGLGSIKALNKYEPPLPSPVKDLRVIGVNFHIFTLQWTSSGKVGDVGMADLIQIRATTNYSLADSIEDSYIFKDTDVFLGTLKASLAGEKKKIYLAVPHQMWLQSDQGRHLYFVIRTGNSDTGFSLDSNIASASYVRKSVKYLVSKAKGNAQVHSASLLAVIFGFIVCFVLPIV